MRKLNLLMILLIMAFCGNSQDKKIDFKNSKPYGSDKVVYFKINNLANDEDIENLNRVFSGDAGIREHSLNKARGCKLVISQAIDAEYIRGRLLSAGLDYDLSTILVNDALVLKDMIAPLQKNRTDGMPEHYPVYINTGRPDIDNALFDCLKKEWVRDYPSEYARIGGISTDKVYSDQINANQEPEFIDTGNPEKDMKSFSTAKEKWNKIQKNTHE